MSNAHDFPPDLLVADLDWLTPDLAVGGDLSPSVTEAAAQARWMARQGVTDIIDCRAEHTDEDLVAAFCPGIRYHHLRTDDHGGVLDESWWDEGIEIARHVARAGGSVFVHCHMGVNRGPSLALAILFDRGVDVLAGFELLRARRPQAFAIYAPQYLVLDGRLEDAEVLQSFMELECPPEQLRATIGRIRQAEATGYRFPLETGGPGDRIEESVEPVSDCERCSHDRSFFTEMTDLMEEVLGGPSTEWPTDWVRSLLREIEDQRRTVTFRLPEGMDMQDLDDAVEQYRQGMVW